MNEIDRIFDYYPGTEKQERDCIHVRSEIKSVARLLSDRLPVGREKEMALIHLE